MLLDVKGDGDFLLAGFLHQRNDPRFVVAFVAVKFPQLPGAFLQLAVVQQRSRLNGDQIAQLGGLEFLVAFEDHFRHFRIELDFEHQHQPSVRQFLRLEHHIGKITALRQPGDILPDDGRVIFRPGTLLNIVQQQLFLLRMFALLLNFHFGNLFGPGRRSQPEGHHQRQLPLIQLLHKNRPFPYST